MEFNFKIYEAEISLLVNAYLHKSVSKLRTVKQYLANVICQYKKIRSKDIIKYNKTDQITIKQSEDRLYIICCKVSVTWKRVNN